MTQLAIQFADEPRSRRSDPQTSHKAGARAQHFAGSHRDRIHQALKTHGPRSAHELSLLIGLTVVQVDRRLPELKERNLARVAKLDDGADVVRNHCRVWEAVV